MFLLFVQQLKFTLAPEACCVFALCNWNLLLCFRPSSLVHAQLPTAAALAAQRHRPHGPGQCFSLHVPYQTLQRGKLIEKIKLNHAPKISEQVDLRFPVLCLVWSLQQNRFKPDVHVCFLNLSLIDELSQYLGEQHGLWPRERHPGIAHTHGG